MLSTIPGVTYTLDLSLRGRVSHIQTRHACRQHRGVTEEVREKRTFSHRRLSHDGHFSGVLVLCREAAWPPWWGSCGSGIWPHCCARLTGRGCSELLGKEAGEFSELRTATQPWPFWRTKHVRWGLAEGTVTQRCRTGLPGWRLFSPRDICSHRKAMPFPAYHHGC